ncbi:MAG: RIP metalloprotease RseP [Puniceicoccaceae bacterium]
MFDWIFSSIWTFLLVLLFFGGSIFFHELGHFLAAKARGLKILRFSVGFGPAILKFTRQDIEYRLGILPLGGYVALPQLAEMGRLEGSEEGDTNSGELPPISYSDRVIVAVSGPFANILFALVLSTGLWLFGRDVPASSMSTTIGHVVETLELEDGSIVPSPAFNADLRTGDRVLSVDGKEPRDWMDLTYGILAGSARDAEGNRLTRLKIDRDGEILEKEVFPVLHTGERIRTIGIQPADTVVLYPTPDGPAAKAGVLEGDHLISLNGQPVQSFTLVSQIIGESGGQPVQATLQRGSQTIELEITPTLQEHPERGQIYLIGVQMQPLWITVHIGPLTQIEQMGRMVMVTLSGLINPRSDVKLRNLSGPVGIIHSIHRLSVEITMLIWFVTFLNINLAILNLMPIPVLDGGHIMFATINKVRGRPLPRRILETVQGAFMILLLFGLMVFLTYHDIRRIFFE